MIRIENLTLDEIDVKVYEIGQEIDFADALPLLPREYAELKIPPAGAIFIVRCKKKVSS